MLFVAADAIGVGSLNRAWGVILAKRASEGIGILLGRALNQAASGETVNPDLDIEIYQGTRPPLPGGRAQ